MGREVIEHIPFVQARWYKAVKPGRHIQYIVLHSMEAPEKGTTAESVARYFQTLPATRKASAHYTIDSDSIVQCVQTKDVAYAAPYVNHNGIHLELAGYARQTRAEWLDPYSSAMLKNAAWLCGKILIPKYSLPVRVCLAADLKRGVENTVSVRGFTTHAEASKAFKPGGHWDPGPGFPLGVFLSYVQAAIAGTLEG
jgi:N-acetyl-anhydromuramyl-L-alanine amidase AmpD